MGKQCLLSTIFMKTNSIMSVAGQAVNAEEIAKQPRENIHATEKEKKKTKLNFASREQKVDHKNMVSSHILFRETEAVGSYIKNNSHLGK